MDKLGGLILTALVATTACSEDSVQGTVEDDKVTNVQVYRITAQTFTEYITLPVVVVPYREANLSLVTGGKIAKVLAQKGDQVAEDAVLLETESEMLGAALNLAKANLSFQKGEFSRTKRLFAAGSIPQSAFDGGKLALAQAQSQLEIAQKQYDNATLKAPFAGTITMRNAEVGTVLGPATAAFRLIDISRAKIQAGIPERYIEDFRKGHTVAVTLDAMPDKELRGQINYIAPEASPSVRTFLAEITVDNSAGAIRAGTMGNARIQRRSFDKALLIPLDALIETQAGRRVFVVKDDSVAAERSIAIGGNGDGMLVVIEGLQAGEVLITKGQHDLVAGDRVRVASEYKQVPNQEVSVR